MTGDARAALVTGAAGFIGSHLVEHLLDGGWRVRGLDDFSAGRPENLRGPLTSPDFDLVEGTVLDERRTALLTAGVTHVFHLAGRVGADYVERNPERTVLDSVAATRAVLSAVREHRVPLFFASTSEVYGDTEAQPLTEGADLVIAPPANPRASYGLGKAVGELLVNDYVRREGGRAVIGRYFNTIGPRQSGEHGLVVPRFLERAGAGDPLVLHGDGHQTRSFTFVGDAVSATVALLTTPVAEGWTVNIGSDVETSVVELARLVIRLTGSSSPIEHVPYDQVHTPGARDIRRRVPDTDRLRRLTGVECATPLETAIKAILRSSAEPVVRRAG